jgi:integrase/recombinase XerD
MERSPDLVAANNHHHIGQQLTDDPNFDRKLDYITAGSTPFLKKHLLNRITKENCSIIIDYITAMQTEIRLSDRYRIDTIYKLKQLAEYHNPKSFRDMSRQDIVDFLDRLRKPEQVDPLHRWIGTYEISRIVLLRFFKWLYRPPPPNDDNDDLSPTRRPKPAVMQNIPQIKRREITTYKPTDLWTEEDDMLFYKYCPSPRDRCWHAISRDTGCRPHELLKLKVRDIVAQQYENGYQIAKITVNGKTGVRSIRLNNSYPKLKYWLSNAHPYPGNPNAPLFCGTGKKNTGRKLAAHTIQTSYLIYKKVKFPKLLEDPTVSEEDKRKIKDLLQKPWNPYLRRHTAATEISKAVKDSVLIDNIMGWSHSGNTRQKYQHYFADDGNDALLTLMDGLPPQGQLSLKSKKNKDLLKPKQCPNCDEINDSSSKFCTKCRYVLSYDGQYELEADAERSKEEQQKLKKKLDDIYAMSIKHSDRWKLFLSTLQDAMRSEGKKSSEALAVALKTINTLE